MAVPNQQISSTEAIDNVFGTAELVECILLHLPLRQLVLKQIVCRCWREVAQGSPSVRRALFLDPACALRIWASQVVRYPPVSRSPRDPFSEFVWMPTPIGRGELRYPPILNPFINKHTFCSRIVSGNIFNPYAQGTFDTNNIDDATSDEALLQRMLLLHPPATDMVMSCTGERASMGSSAWDLLPRAERNEELMRVEDVPWGVWDHCQEGCEHDICPEEPDGDARSYWGHGDIDFLGEDYTVEGYEAEDRVTGWEVLYEMRRREEVLPIGVEQESDGQGENDEVGGEVEADNDKVDSESEVGAQDWQDAAADADAGNHGAGVAGETVFNGDKTTAAGCVG
ncbi:uncharacterized protein LTR77_005488 [Saxophila tyrrhenica]|uniref:F-box domain-containing protein n=1 Tax=Saxophila tyrrhenica TaxID=1690608 RepID=A0AAV9P978_9PEZI|nr:hypothetical protein LTR77_005488 [Saxophila tyrrhenica]